MVFACFGRTGFARETQKHEEMLASLCLRASMVNFGLYAGTCCKCCSRSSASFFSSVGFEGRAMARASSMVLT